MIPLFGESMIEMHMPPALLHDRPVKGNDSVFGEPMTHAYALQIGQARA